MRHLLSVALCALIPFAMISASVAAPKSLTESSAKKSDKSDKKTAKRSSSKKRPAKRRSASKKRPASKKPTGIKRPTRATSKRGAGSMKRPSKPQRSKGLSTPAAKGSKSRATTAPSKRAPTKRTATKGLPSKRGAKRGGFEKRGKERSNTIGGKGPGKQRMSPRDRAKREALERRKAEAGVKGKSTTTTTTTTTTTKRTKTGKRVMERKNADTYQEPTYQEQEPTYQEQEPTYREQEPTYREHRPAPAPAYAPPPPPSCRPQGNKFMVNLGAGFEATDGIDTTNTAFVLGAGLRSGFLGLAGEAHFNQNDGESELSAMAGQVRLYLPVGDCVDIYPLAGISQQNLGAASAKSDDDVTNAFDLGVGLDLNLGGVIGLGVRYTRSFFNDNLSLVDIPETDVNGSNSRSRDTFIAQLAIYF